MVCLLLAHRHQLPHRPAVFLDWAHEAGLVRLARVAVQFRHRDFQDWLTDQLFGRGIGGGVCIRPDFRR